MKDLIAIVALVLMFEGVVCYEAYKAGIWKDEDEPKEDE